MHLITMAHPGEAQGVIETFRPKQLSEGLYQCDDFVLLITGEGPFEAATKTALTLSKFAFNEVLNLGIAGTLDQSFKVGEIHPVRTVYLVQNLVPQFKTFQGFEKGLDCITSFERILDIKKAQTLKGIGSLVDREAWGVAMAAKTAGVPFRSYKLISDMAGTIENCEIVKDKAQDFAVTLSNFLKSLTGKKSDELSLPGFYFTFTSTHQFNDLLKKLSIKDEKPESEILELLPLDDLRSLDITPKERAKRLIQQMDKKLDPVKAVLEIRKSQWQEEFQKAGIKVQTDPHWENPSVNVSFEVTDDESLKNKIEALKSLSVLPYQKLMKGDFNVE